MKAVNKDTKVLSHEVRAIIFDKPHWILRKGILMLLLLFCCLTATTFFISYPAMVMGKGKVISTAMETNAINRYYVQVCIAQRDAMSVKQGQRVLLKLDANPLEEFSVITGIVDSVSNIVTDTGCQVKIILPNGLKSNNKKQVKFYKGLTVKAEIVIKNSKISDILLSRLKNL